MSKRINKMENILYPPTKKKVCINELCLYSKILLGGSGLRVMILRLNKCKFHSEIVNQKDSESGVPHHIQDRTM